MHTSLLLASLALSAASVQAAPFQSARTDTPLTRIAKRQQPASSTDKHSNYITEVQIHESCNPAQTRFLRSGLDEMVTLAKHAHDRIMRYGEEDDLYVKYFGNASMASASGFYASMVWGNKPGVLLRCDNPDGNCEQVTADGKTWAGHWRGDNATLETVICPRTYTERRHLNTLCFDGHEIGHGIVAEWLATDLLHRMTHISAITYNKVHHAADSYPDVIALAASNSSETVFNQNTFQFFALDAYARDVAYPPNGCIAADALTATTDDGHGHSSSATSASVSASATATATSTIDTAQSQAATTTKTAANACHTHEDGVVHCGAH
ncbi:Prenylated Rab acceptor protein 1 [Microbotryomycetes sp. JL201]|nr:Prenylated Rab acceptor protein 1 [Microbotryomycetes sp. JL201]